MTDWPDAKIRATALRYIDKATITTPAWRFTLIDKAHPEVLARANLEEGESPLVSCYISEASWYLLSTRRVVGVYGGQKIDVGALDIHVDHSGDFKGYGGEDLELMTLRLNSGREMKVQYETGRASMAPIYYFRYWRVKYPVLGKLTA
ncbi:MAG TPA: hypothetical protein VN893_11075 [Bryobacteraceae bacterium]|nr:hypothetical protein [Bryobacteraceae bacterium]